MTKNYSRTDYATPGTTEAASDNNDMLSLVMSTEWMNVLLSRMQTMIVQQVELAFAMYAKSSVKENQPSFGQNKRPQQSFLPAIPR